MTSRNPSARRRAPVVSTVYVLSCPHRAPVGRLEFAVLRALATSSIPIPRVASAVGSTLTRTAYFWEPKIWTCATPDTCEMRCAIMFSPYSFSSYIASVGEVRAMYRIGWSAGFTFWNDGGEGISGGRLRAAREIAACTSWAAASRSRPSTNWSVTCVLPRALDEFIESSPAIVENSFSSGGRDRGGHRLGGGAGERGLHLERREVDVGEVAHRERAIGGGGAERQDRDHEERRRDGSPDEERGGAHDGPACCGGADGDLGPRNDPELPIGDHGLSPRQALGDHRLLAERSVDDDGGASPPSHPRGRRRRRRPAGPPGSRRSVRSRRPPAPKARSSPRRTGRARAPGRRWGRSHRAGSCRSCGRRRCR